MKRLIFTIIIIFSSHSLFAQCTPDTTITSPNIYPDEITNLPEGYVGQPYVAQIDVLTPLDTSVSLSGLNVNVTIDNIELTSVSGLPNNFTIHVILQHVFFQVEHMDALKFFLQ